MKIRVLFLGVLLLFFFKTVSAQEKSKSILLSWEDNAEITSSYSDFVITQPLLVDGLFDKNNIPYYFEQWEVNSNLEVESFSIVNIVYENINTNLFTKTNVVDFSKKIESSFEIKNARDIAFAQLKLMPLVYKAGKLKRVLSFDIKYKYKQRSRKKSISTIHDSKLADGNWYKFAIDTTGVYKLNKSFLNSLGIDTNGINPKNIQIFGNGGARLAEANHISKFDGLQENAVFISGEEDDRFDANDYILFYAEGPDIWIPSLAASKAKHSKNVYSDKAYYFIHVGNDVGKRIQNSTPITAAADIQLTTFNDYAIHELEKINLDHFGQDFFGEGFAINDVQNFSIDFNDIDLAQDASVELAVATVSSLGRKTSFVLKYNEQTVVSLNDISMASYSVGATRKGSNTFTPINEMLDFQVTFNNQGNPSAKAYLDYIEVNGIKKLIARNKQMSFRNFSLANETTDKIGEFILENKNNVFQVWDVSDKINPLKITTTSTDSNFVFSCQGGVLHEFVMLNTNDFYTPIKLPNSLVANQNLHAIKDIDYLIVTSDELLNEANRLANHHKNTNGLTTLVLSEQLIYNEFSSGGKDPMAIRGFIKHLYDNATTPEKRIKYVLMFGDTSFDFQNIQGDNFKRINGVTTTVNVIGYQSKNSTSLTDSYGTDDFFVMLDDNEGEFISSNGSGDLIDVAVGRIPVKNNTEAINAIDKTLEYYSKESFGKWRNTVTFLADDMDKAGEDIFMKREEQIAAKIKEFVPSINVNKIYADAYEQQITSGGQAYPQVNEAINNTIETGTLFFNYFGHGGENGLGFERFVDNIQIGNWYNKNKSTLFITVTCEFSRHDNPVRVSAGERVFSNRNGGSVNMISTSREVYINFGASFNINLIENILEYETNDNLTIAESLARTKNEFSTRVQRLFISYFGDPAMKIAKPNANIKITEMNGRDIEEEPDVIKALSHVYFKGIVTDEEGGLLPNFSGNLSVTIFDKFTIRETLNNDGNADIIQFDVRDSKIFNGKATVENGYWEFDFIAPRDIRITLGKAKLSFYAENQIIDRSGYNTDITIGGINYDAPEDNIGPKIKLFMNDESFIDGGNTNESPVFLAHLEDESGINTSFTAVGHDIEVILDNDQSNPIILNDYYETETDSFKKGIVKFPFRDLSVGMHTLTFKCWDTYNNVSKSSLSFVVVSDAGLVLDNVLNYPNPFINYTEFWFNHNKPNESLSVQVQIFTVSGKLIKTIRQDVLDSGTLVRSIKWDGLDDFGNKLGKGVYIYKLKVKTIAGSLEAEKIEKLVILQ